MYCILIHASCMSTRARARAVYATSPWDKGVCCIAPLSSFVAFFLCGLVCGVGRASRSAGLHIYKYMTAVKSRVRSLSRVMIIRTPLLMSRVDGDCSLLSNF